MLTKIIEWVRFGKITEHVKAIDGGVASEIEYRDRKGRPIGYWAYGSFDPAGAYPLKPIYWKYIWSIACCSTLAVISLCVGNILSFCGWVCAGMYSFQLRNKHIQILHLEGKMP